MSSNEALSNLFAESATVRRDEVFADRVMTKVRGGTPVAVILVPALRALGFGASLGAAGLGAWWMVSALAEPAAGAINNPITGLTVAALVLGTVFLRLRRV